MATRADNDLDLKGNAAMLRYLLERYRDSPGKLLEEIGFLIDEARLGNAEAYRALEQIAGSFNQIAESLKSLADLIEERHPLSLAEANGDGLAEGPPR